MKKELGWEKFNEFDSLERMFKGSFGNESRQNNFFAREPKVLRKFKNEFDRGEQFNFLVKQMLP